MGITLNNLSAMPDVQLNLFDTGKEQNGKLDDALMKLQLKYGRGIVKSANVLRAEKRLEEED